MSNYISFIKSFSTLIAEYRKCRESDESNKKSVFEIFTDKYYEENYHNRLIGFYFEHSDGALAFVKWINIQLKKKKRMELIPYSRYKHQIVEVETNRIDIALYNAERNHAVIIESKSNKAKNQFNQIVKYVQKLEDSGVTVDAIIYLNLDNYKTPDIHQWKVDENTRQEIEDKMIITNLKDSKGIQTMFTSPLLKTKDEHLKFQASDIKLLFDNLHGGETEKKEKEVMKEFMHKLVGKESFRLAKEFVYMYNQIPKYMLKKCKDEVDNRMKRKTREIIENISRKSRSNSSAYWYVFTIEHNKEKYELSITIEFTHNEATIWIYDKKKYDKDVSKLFPTEQYKFLKKYDDEWYGVSIPIEKYLSDAGKSVVNYILKILDRVAELLH